MPHIILEHTNIIKNDIIQSIFNELINILIKNANIKKENCKCRAYHISTYTIGKNDSEHFYHLKISLLKGRSNKIINVIGNKSLQILNNIISKKNQNNNLQFSVEIIEISKENYFTSNIL